MEKRGLIDNNTPEPESCGEKSASDGSVQNDNTAVKVCKAAEKEALKAKKCCGKTDSCSK